MRFTVVLLAAVCLFAAMALAGPKGTAIKKNAHKHCLKGRKKNGRCVSGKLRVRSADSDEFYEIPNVEDAHWGALDGE